MKSVAEVYKTFLEVEFTLSRTKLTFLKFTISTIKHYGFENQWMNRIHGKLLYSLLLVTQTPAGSQTSEQWIKGILTEGEGSVQLPSL